MPSTASRLIGEAMRGVGAALRVALVVPSHLTTGRVVAGTDLVATLPRRIATKLATQLRQIQRHSVA